MQYNIFGRYYYFILVLWFIFSVGVSVMVGLNTFNNSILINLLIANLVIFIIVTSSRLLYLHKSVWHILTIIITTITLFFLFGYLRQTILFKVYSAVSLAGQPVSIVSILTVIVLATLPVSLVLGLFKDKEEIQIQSV